MGNLDFNTFVTLQCVCTLWLNFRIQRMWAEWSACERGARAGGSWTERRAAFLKGRSVAL